MRRFTFALVTTLLVLALAEGAARWFGPPPMPPADAGAPPPGAAEPDLVGDVLLGWRVRPGWNRLFGVPEPTHVTARGLRGPDVPAEPAAGERRVLLLGDSSVYGVRVRDADTFARRAEAILRRVDPGIAVLDAGCPGYSSWQALRLLRERLLDLHPSLVVATLWSDTQGAEAPDSVRIGGAPRARVAALLHRSRLYLLLRDRIVTWRWGGPVPPPSDGSPGVVATGLSPPLSPTFRVPLAEYRANLDAIAELARSSGAEVAFLVLPCVRDVDDGRVGDFRDAWREAMRDAARRHRAPLADAPPAFVGGDPRRLFVDEVHPSAAGHARIARVLADALAAWAARTATAPEG